MAERGPDAPDRAAGRAKAWHQSSRTALAGLLALAAALRLVGIEYGLPFGLLNPDEQSIVPRAWKMVHGGGLHPHWFDYPPLVMYVLPPFPAWQAAPPDPTPPVRDGRPRPAGGRGGRRA